MADWERLEQYLYDHNKLHTDFTVYDYAASEGLDTSLASIHIQAYLNAQRVRPRLDKDGNPVGGSGTAYVLRRVEGTRTRNARWAVGTRAKDAKAIGSAFSDDVLARAERAFRPDLLRLAEINPRQAARTRRQVRAVLNGALVVLQEAAQGIGEDDDDGAQA